VADERTYIKVHDGMPDHWKIEALSDRAFRLLVETWCWCSRHLNNGRFPMSSWQRRGTPKARKEIEAIGLVEADGDGWVQMHDYLEHQRSAEQVEDIREKKRRAAAQGNHKRWHEDRSIVDPECGFCNPGSIAGASSNGSHVRSQSDRTGNRKRSPEAEAEAEKIKDGGEDSGSSSHQPGRAKKRCDDLAALAGTAHSPTAHRLVQAYAASRSRRPPARVLAQLGPLVDELLEQEWPEDLIGHSLTAWGDKGLDPARLHSVANEIANRKSANGSKPARRTTDDRIAEFVTTPGTGATLLQLPGGTA
jgi:hypothetical protein